MDEYNFIEASYIYPNFNDQQVRLNKTSKIRNYFIAEIRE